MKAWLWMIFAALFLLSAAHAEDTQTDIVYSSRAGELAPILSPFAAPEGSVSAYQNQLIIRATPAKLLVIHDTLKKLDRPLKNLRISVRRRQQGRSSNKVLGGTGNVRIQNDEISGRLVIRADEQQNTTQSQNHYSISAVEGSTVFITAGSDIPVLTVISTNTGTVLGNQYVPVQSGMQVTPRLMPDNRVMLAIDVQQAAIANRHGVIDSDNTQTQLQIPLGVWTQLSQIERSSSSSSSGMSGIKQQSQSSSTPLEILVEVLP